MYKDCISLLVYSGYFGLETMGLFPTYPAKVRVASKLEIRNKNRSITSFVCIFLTPGIWGQ